MLTLKKIKSYHSQLIGICITMFCFLPFSIMAQEDEGNAEPSYNIEKIKKESEGGNTNAMMILASA